MHVLFRISFSTYAKLHYLTLLQSSLLYLIPKFFFHTAKRHCGSFVYPTRVLQDFRLLLPCSRGFLSLATLQFGSCLITFREKITVLSSRFKQPKKTKNKVHRTSQKGQDHARIFFPSVSKNKKVKLLKSPRCMCVSSFKKQMYWNGFRDQATYEKIRDVSCKIAVAIFRVNDYEGYWGTSFLLVNGMWEKTI